jgi:peptidyl-prolyl cis-trans isomerase SurA
MRREDIVNIDGFIEIFIVLVLCAVSAVSPALAQSTDQRGTVIDRIVAVVEDRAVLQSDLELEYARYLMQMQRSSLPDEEEAETKKQILDALVSELIMAIHAEKSGIEVAEGEVEQSIDNFIEENKRALGGETAFRRELEREGMTLDDLRESLRERIKARMLIERLRYREVLGNVRVTEGETRDYYKEHLAELPKRPVTVTLAHVLMIPKVSEKAREAAHEKILDVERRLKDGQDFASLAKEFSDDPSAPAGGSLGYVKLKDLNSPAFEAAARKLSVGDISPPVLTQFGYHVIKLDDVSGDEVLIRHILAKVEADEEDVERAARLAEEVRQRLVDGAGFDEMAAQYSDDPATKDKGGVVGEISLENLPEFFREIIEDVGIGEIAPVIREQKGFRIIKMLGKTPEREYTFDEAREELRRLIEQQKRQELLQKYVDELKEIYYVEVKEERG